MTTTPDLWRNPFLVEEDGALHNQDSGVVAATAGNQFFAVWVDRDNFNSMFDAIIARKFDSLGNPLTGEVNLAPTFLIDLLNPAAVRLPIAGQADGLAVAYESIVSATDHDIFVQRTDAALNLLNP